MYYVYVLLCRDHNFYIGYTKDLGERIRKHQHGAVRSTKPRLPVKLIYAEYCLHQYDALRREKYLKTTRGRQYIRKRLRYFLASPEQSM